MRFETRMLLLVTILVGLAGGLQAQSVTSIRGLGYPIVPVDARAEALGGIGVGVQGLTVPFTNPASVAGVTRRGVVISSVATDQQASLGEASSEVNGSRFPLIRVVIPAGGVVVSAGYGAFLDQAWSVERTGTQTLGTSDVTYRDGFSSVGGVGQAQLAAAVPVGWGLSVGLSIGALTGRQDLGISRRYDSTAVGNLQPFTETRSVQYSGTTGQVGFQWDVTDEVRVGGSFTWSGTLRADSADGRAVTREYDLPLQAAGGLSAYLAPGLLATAAGRWSGWSVTEASGGLLETVGTVASRDTWEVGGGLELDNPERRERYNFPLRVGFQYRQLPFAFVGDNAPSEWLASAGFGLRVGADFNTPMARIDVTVQRGARTAAGDATLPELEETLWRLVLGVAIFGT